jgi:hypothetical protein
MDIQDPRIRSLLRQADRVAETGKRAAAVGLYRQIIEEAPDTALAWLGLAQTVTDPAEQEAAYQRVLELDPDNEAARVALDPSEPPLPEEAVSPDGRLSWDDLAASMAWADEALGKSSAKEKGRAGETAPEQMPADEAKIESGRGGRDLATADAEAEVDGAGPAAAELVYCANHPRVETSLRCNRCGKPMCSRCAKLTPVGYRCPECIREREDVFFNATPADYVLAGVVGLILGLVFGVIVPWIGFFALFVAPAAGAVTGKLILWTTGRRRGRWLPLATTVIFVLAGVPIFLIYGLLGSIFGLIFYLLMAPSSLYYTLK